MQRTGYIRELARRYKEHARIPFKDRTAGVGEPWVYDAFVSLLRREMRTASKNENFEEAILWRDAIWKLETKNDIYDAIHAVDLLRKKITEPEILNVVEKYRLQYVKIKPGQPEHRDIG
jgi:excinuclease UvrABC helicase subunit UvrB